MPLKDRDEITLDLGAYQEGWDEENDRNADWIMSPERRKQKLAMWDKVAEKLGIVLGEETSSVK